jgi:hypothetical protein
VGGTGRSGRLTAALALPAPDRYLPAIPPQEPGISHETRPPTDIGLACRLQPELAGGGSSRAPSAAHPTQIVDLSQQVDRELPLALRELRARLDPLAQEPGT